MRQTRYLTYHQLKVTQILVALAQSIHELVPPEDLHPVVTKIANEFVNDGVSSEVIAAGINAIREICRRQPWVMDKKRYLLKDLTDYRKSKDKGVITAARGLLALYREVAPGLLEKRDRVRQSRSTRDPQSQLLMLSAIRVKLLLWVLRGTLKFWHMVIPKRKQASRAWK